MSHDYKERAAGYEQEVRLDEIFAAFGKPHAELFIKHHKVITCGTKGYRIVDREDYDLPPIMNSIAWTLADDLYLTYYQKRVDAVAALNKTAEAYAWLAMEKARPF